MASNVKIGTVWDHTTAVLAGRSAMIAPVAVLALVVPPAVQSAITLFLPVTPFHAILGFVVSIASLLLSLWGALAIIAMASDPATDRAAAQRQATARLPAVIGVTIVLMLIAVALVLPIFVVLAATGFDFQAAATAMATNAPALVPRPAASATLFTLLYSLVLLVFGFWVSARLVLTNAVVLHERLGLGAIRRSVALTRGLTLKLIGVAILFSIVLVIAAVAAQSVVGLVFRLILGASGISVSLFLAGVAGAAVSAAMLSLAYVFIAQLYVATREKPITE